MAKCVRWTREEGGAMAKPSSRLRAVVLGLGYAFLYIPILVLMVLSFNDSAMMTTWTGFSLRWYHELFNDRALLEAARLSLVIAAFTATAALVVGTWAGYVLARMGRFKGFALFVALVSAPLVIPRSEEHTSELQSRENLVCRLL